MKPETVDYLAKARGDLNDARTAATVTMTEATDAIETASAFIDRIAEILGEA